MIAKLALVLLALVLLAMVIAPGSRIDRNQKISLGTGRMHMVQTATAHHVYGDCQHNADVESAVQDRSPST